MGERGDLAARIADCRLCAARFAATASGHAPRPVVWFAASARILVAGQAPGVRVHGSGLPFDDASGERLRDWMGIDRAVFYDRARIAVVPMAFCFPGQDGRGGDLPPPPICAKTWRAAVMGELPGLRLSLLLGGAAQAWHLGRAPVAQRVAEWRHWAAQGVFPLPHPSWRNSGWLQRHPWFAAELLPELRLAVARMLEAE